MAAESNTGFQYQHMLNRHAISFQSGAINCTSEMIPMGNYYGVNNSTGGGIMFSGNSSIINTNQGINQAGNCSSSLLLDSVPGLKHDPSLAVEWSVDEQYKLDEGLNKYADEPSIMKYVKIAASLRDKTVRDVALRCRWMSRKRRKHEDHNFGKKVKDRKDKLMESSLKKEMSSASPSNMAAYSFSMNHRDQSGRIPCEVSSTTRHLLEQNNQVLGQISSNLSTFKLTDNIDLILCTRNNITAILNEMENMPGIMRQMPPLNVHLNDDLANDILQNTSQTMMFGSSNGIHMKQEPGC